MLVSLAAPSREFMEEKETLPTVPELVPEMVHWRVTPPSLEISKVLVLLAPVPPLI